MCGIAGIISLDGSPVPRLGAALEVLDRRIAHRGPDGRGVWTSPTPRRRSGASQARDHRPQPLGTAADAGAGADRDHL